MNYFELFGIPIQLRPSKEAIRRRFFELSRQYHPDYFATKDAGAQEEALEKSALVNKAYKTLLNEDDLVRYLLQEKGLMEPDEKYALDSAFLMEMMELNEEVPEALEDEGARKRLSDTLEQWKNKIYAPVETIMANYQDGITTEEELLQMKAFYYRKKYLQRLAGQLGQKL